jgi:Sec-independent protein translocase protein TatA
MKKQILKIAGVKSEKEFYKKYPTEEAFMKEHGKAFKKAERVEKLQNGPTTGLLSIPNPADLTQADQDINQQFYEDNLPTDVEELKQNLDYNKLQAGVQASSTIGQNIQKISKAIQEKKQAKVMRQISPIIAKAASTRPEQIERRYVRPEDIVNTGEEFFPIYGVGTNVLARNGASVGGGEIMNTFAPNTLYDNLGYEPLNESERMKQFYHGGKMHTAGAGDVLPLVQEGVNTLGDLTAGIISLGTNRLNKQSEKYLGEAAFQSGIQGLQKGQYQSYMQDGGTTSPYEWVSHTWQPQVITTFGEHKLKDLLTPPKDADMLRAGGHLKEYTPPSAAAMSTERPDFQMGGELQTHWGGYAEPMSYNPYLPEGGETVMFRGQSHNESDGKGNTGIGITYGDNPVEVERGEPAMKMKDGSGGDSSLVVFGNLKIPDLLGDPAAKGKNFKRYVADLSKQEKKQNNLMDKSVTAIDEMEVQTPFDRLKFNSLQANVMGANLKLKDYAQKKMDASALQTAMNDTIEEFGLKTTDKGNIMAKLGANIMKAQTGTKTLSKLEAMENVPKQTKTGKYYGGVTDQMVAQMKINNPWYDWQNFDPTNPADIEDFQKSFNAKAQEQGVASRLKVDKKLGQQMVSAKGLYTESPIKTETLPTITITGNKSTPAEKEKEKEVVQPVGSKKFPWMTVFNEALPFLRPTDVEQLDANQLAGEMYALSTNQLEPVKAQTFQPQLSVPYDISLQDILNENEATFRNQQRLFGYNPSLQSQLSGQKYAANQKVLGEQFRLNQGLKNQIYKENRDLLNQSQLQNLGILDQQYERQEMAKSKTKATTQAALNSIAAKYAQNKLENRTLQTYENLFNYRFDPRFRAINMNPLVDFDAMIANASPAQLAEYRKMLEAKAKKSEEKSVKNGYIVRSLKNL